MKFKSGDLVMVVRSIPGCTCSGKYIGRIFVLDQHTVAAFPMCGGCGACLIGPQTLWVYPEFENHPVYGSCGFIEYQLKKIPPLEELQETEIHIPAEA